MSRIIDIINFIPISVCMNKANALSAFAALSQETRLDTLVLLVKAGSDGVAAGELARHLGIRHNLMSQHLNVLSQAGLVSSERQGRSIIYRVSFSALRGLSTFLLSECCQGLPEIVGGLEDSTLSLKGAP